MLERRNAKLKKEEGGGIGSKERNLSGKESNDGCSTQKLTVNAQIDVLHTGNSGI